MINKLGDIIVVIGLATFAITSIWGFFLTLAIITKAAGFWGLVAAIFVFPVTFFAAPLYAGFAFGDWFPLALNYGGGIVSAALIGIGFLLSSR